LYATSDIDKAVTTVGYKNVPGQPDFKYGGVPTPEACKAACDADAGCLGWIHYGAKADEQMRGTCSLIANKQDGAQDFRGVK